MNVNFGPNIAGTAHTQSSPATSTNVQSTPTQAPAESHVSYQNASTQTTLNILTQQMMSGALMLNAMDVRELSMLIKELLSMPKEIQQLLAMLAFGDASPENVAKVFKDLNLQALLSQLQGLIGKNSKEAINKLIQLTQNSALFFEGSHQLRDIMGLLQKVAFTTQSSPADALTMALILYLPWLPLAEQQRFELDFGYKEDEKTGAKTDCEVLILYISTINIGTFKVTILLNSDKSLEINIESDQLEEGIVKKLISNVREELSSTGVKMKIEASTRKQPESKSPKEMKKETNKSLSLHPTGKISIVTINAGHTVARAIFAKDEKIGLLKYREEKIK